MAYYPSEIVPPPDPETQRGPGIGYPTGTPQAPIYYPNVPATPPLPNNPYGVANTPDEYPAIIANPPTTPYAYAYSFQTFEEKIAGTVPPGVPVVPVTVAANEPYPTTP